MNLTLLQRIDEALSFEKLSPYVKWLASLRKKGYKIEHGWNDLIGQDFGAPTPKGHNIPDNVVWNKHFSNKWRNGAPVPTFFWRNGVLAEISVDQLPPFEDVKALLDREADIDYPAITKSQMAHVSKFYDIVAQDPSLSYPLGRAAALASKMLGVGLRGEDPLIVARRIKPSNAKEWEAQVLKGISLKLKCTVLPDHDISPLGRQFRPDKDDMMDGVE